MHVHDDLARMRAAYLRPATVANWSARERAERLDAMAGAGIDTVVTKLKAATGPVAEDCRARGLRVVGSFGCFIDRALPAEVPPELRPVDERGQVFEPMRWYRGVIPTSQRYLDDLGREMSTHLVRTDVDGVILDFIRWPCHWERELRPGATWRQSSFDPITLRRFNDYLADHGDPGVEPTDPAAAATAVRDRLADRWHNFRVDVVSEACRRLTGIVAASDRWTGAFVVPAMDDIRREVVGQHTQRLGEIVDALLPMTYHVIMRQPPSWIGSISADVLATTSAGSSESTTQGAAVVAMVQGPATVADWDLDPGSAQFVDALTAATTWPGSGAGFCTFPGDEFGPDEARAIRLASR